MHFECQTLTTARLLPRALPALAAQLRVAAAALAASDGSTSAEKACIGVARSAVLPTDAENAGVAAVAVGIAQTALVLGSRGAAAGLLDTGSANIDKARPTVFPTDAENIGVARSARIVAKEALHVGVGRGAGDRRAKGRGWK